MIGWAAATGGISVESVLMFALIFMWTPPHFWALALFMNEDYTKADIPMLTVTHGPEKTRAHILAYTGLLVVTSLSIGLTSIGGPVYLATAVVMNLWFGAAVLQVYRRDNTAAISDEFRAEKRAFKVSLYYLFAHFVALLADAALQGMA